MTGRASCVLALLCASFLLFAAPALAAREFFPPMAGSMSRSADGVGSQPPVATTSAARVYRMKRDDMRIALNVKGGRIVRVHVRARERCGRNGPTGFLKFDLGRIEAVRIRGNGRFHFGASFDDARGSAEVLLNGEVHRRSITGFFAFKNHQDRSCGTGRPGHRKVSFRAHRA